MIIAQVQPPDRIDDPLFWTSMFTFLALVVNKAHDLYVHRRDRKERLEDERHKKEESEMLMQRVTETKQVAVDAVRKIEQNTQITTKAAEASEKALTAGERRDAMFQRMLEQVVSDAPKET